MQNQRLPGFLLLTAICFRKFLGLCIGLEKCINSFKGSHLQLCTYKETAFERGKTIVTVNNFKMDFQVSVITHRLVRLVHPSYCSSKLSK